MKQWAFSGRWRKDAQGNYKASALNLPGAQWANPGAIDAYGKWYTQYRKANPGKSTTAFVSYDDFAQGGGGGYTSPQSAMGQQSSVPQAPSMMGQKSTFSQQPGGQFDSYIQSVQQQIQQLQGQLQQYKQKNSQQQSPQMGGMRSHSSGSPSPAYGSPSPAYGNQMGGMSSSMGGMNKRRSAAEIMARRTGVRQRSYK